MLKVVKAFSNEAISTVWNDLISNPSLVGAILQYTDYCPSFEASVTAYDFYPWKMCQGILTFFVVC